MTARFSIGQRVRVSPRQHQGHHRTPAYVKGRHGTVAHIVGAFADPEKLATGQLGLPFRPLYRVRFRQPDLWPDYAGPATDTLDVELYEHWLEPAP